MQECFSLATQTSPKDLRLNPLPSSIPLSQLSDKLVVSSKCGIHPFSLTAKNCNADSESLGMPQFMEFSCPTQTKMSLTYSPPINPLEINAHQFIKRQHLETNKRNLHFLNSPPHPPSTRTATKCTSTCTPDPHPSRTTHHASPHLSHAPTGCACSSSPRTDSPPSARRCRLHKSSPKRRSGCWAPSRPRP